LYHIAKEVPLIKKESIEKETSLYVWKCVENIEELRSLVVIDEDDLVKLNNFGNPNRKIHFLIIRIICQQLTGSSKIHYNDEGKPFIASTNKHISISHSHDYVAVLLSANPNIGLDIQRKEEKIIRIRERFLNLQENQLIDPNNIEQLTILWCAKESIYKIHGDPTVFFKEHITIHSSSGFQSPHLTAELNHTLYSDIHHLKFEILENYVLVYTVFDSN
jgi:phosphopantetheinyl transferase